MTQSAFEINWLAITCNLAGTDIYLGLTAGMDDVLARSLHPRQMMAFPFQSIKVATNDAKEIPLRVYAVRDPSIVKVRSIAGIAPVDGFHRVQLAFRVPLIKSQNDASTNEKSHAPAATNAVMAFLLTIGLPQHEEDAFYRNVVEDFLRKSWMALPRLLKDIGCATPSAIAEGDSHPRCES